VTGAYIVLTIVAVLAAGFAAIAANAFASMSTSKLEELCRQRNQLPLFDRILERKRSAALAAESLRVVFTVLAVVGLTLWLTLGWHAAFTPADVVLDAIRLLAFVVILWAALIWIPSAAADVWPEAIVYSTWPLWNALAVVHAPVLGLIHFLERGMRWMSGNRELVTEEEELAEEIRSLVTEGQREGVIEEDAREMIESVIELSEVNVAQIMTPRTYMVSLQVEMPWEQVVKFVIDSQHTRIPVYGKTRDEIVGILHIKDMLVEMARPAARRPLAEIVRKPFFVPESKKVDELLPEFQRSRNHMAIVLDEFGGVSGVVTIEDAIEQIVGEIADEYDEALVDGIKVHSETRAEALARVPIHELNERLGLSLPEDQDFDTIGGLIFHDLGRIPAPAEELTIGEVRFRILDASRRRIDRVAIEVLKPQAEQVSEG
jgi:magnesium and cobalt exporter, CNNM family